MNSSFFGQDKLYVTANWTEGAVVLGGLSLTGISRFMESRILRSCIPGVIFPGTLSLDRNRVWTVTMRHGAPFYEASVEKQSVYYACSDEKCIEWDICRILLQIFDYYAHIHENLMLLHSSAILKGSTGVLIIGPPFSGKTVLSLQALSQGWSFLSDEMTVVECRKRKVLAGTPLLYLADRVIERFFPAYSAFLGQTFVDVRELGAPFDVPQENKVALLLMPKVLNSNCGQVEVIELSRNMSIRLLSMEASSNIGGEYLLFNQTKPAISFNNTSLRKINLAKINIILDSLKLFFVEGSPGDILEWAEMMVIR